MNTSMNDHTLILIGLVMNLAALFLNTLNAIWAAQRGDTAWVIVHLVCLAGSYFFAGWFFKQLKGLK